MTVLIVILCILVLILLIPIRAEVEYSAEGIAVKAKLAGISVFTYPSVKKKKKKGKGGKEDKKAKKKKKPKKSKGDQQNGGTKKRKAGGLVSLVLQELPVLGALLGALRRRLVLRPLKLRYIAGGDDAYEVAMFYGKVTLGASALVTAIGEWFKVRDLEIETGADFLAPSATVCIEAGVSIRVGQVLYVVLRYGIRALRVFLKHRKEQTAKNAEKAAKKKKKAEKKGGSPEKKPEEKADGKKPADETKPDSGKPEKK